MKSLSILVVVLLATLTSADQMLNVCNKNVEFDNLKFRFGSKGDAPEIRYWMTNDDSHNQYVIQFERMYAASNKGLLYQFTKAQLSGWMWDLRNCTMSCEMSDDSYEVCEVFYDGNNMESVDSPDRMDMTINVEIHNVNGVNYFRYGILVWGKEMELILDNYNTFEIGVKFNCADNHCNPFNSDDDMEEETYVTLADGYSYLNIRDSTISLNGNGLEACEIHIGVDEDDELCGLRDIALVLDYSYNPRFSVSWDNAVNYDRLFINAYVMTKIVEIVVPEPDTDIDVDPPVIIIEDETDDEDVVVGGVVDDDDDDDDLSDGEIAGIAVGTFFGMLLLLALIGLLLWALLKGGKNKHSGSGPRHASSTTGVAHASSSHV